ncbi:hypothetical protein pEaSNUABM50_00381 [Erwinia phage pEa_SNUABM_50]|uniref:Uncharacterized protein n=4 Tax=Eneladusvirus BF TaxID=2560751 RepID=A0A7L8ZN27_9CAUD|nr:hypothetical protein FDH34_gp538 [Serratia phage BF]QOI71320.1 hypothetical protein pEaSNUABM12_00386 [Erwinia phage pEa_SNUABM_12]QOI71863.1 hypothetical protein pEaSNUABM47_00383 [Erwinia phage pEa_SNUABM_47]QOI72402.1 hypothetical protein pEaSNUABM50_00381 [Erwinia phage pEa_SNUABM_50]QXO11529.1 hypothetical protein pEaSNUABM19_00387 [Erwinia phage pEa_SNUABM_19]QXO12077.1 hypothetical protein pEaSNUABM44_00385 [Erwinia phage pEa_SNUABM_44]
MNPNDLNNSEKYTWCYTWSDLRENYDKLKLVNQEFIELHGFAIPDDVKVGDVFVVVELTEDHGTRVDRGFVIPRHYLDFFEANC